MPSLGENKHCAGCDCDGAIEELEVRRHEAGVVHGIE